VQQQIRTKRIGDYQCISPPKVVTYVISNTRHLIAEIPVSKITPRLAPCYAKASIQQRLAKTRAQLTTAAWEVVDGGRFGTNPCCIGIPLAGRQPFVLDFATSRVAQGKMRVAFNEGRQVAPGILIDTHGRPTTEPGVVVVPQEPGPLGNLMGALLTFGEHKGFGLAVACELLGGALTGGGTWSGTTSNGRAVYNGMLTVLIDPKRLGTQVDFEREADKFMTWIDDAPPAPDVPKVQTAGDPERHTQREREANGIVVDPQTMAELERVAVSVNASHWQSSRNGSPA